MIGASSRRSISLRLRTFDGAPCQIASVLGTAWKRFDRLSKAGVFEAFFDALAAMSSSAHLIQMFDSTIVRAHVSAAGAKGGKKGKRSVARAAASPRKSTQNRTPPATSSPST